MLEATACWAIPGPDWMTFQSTLSRATSGEPKPLSWDSIPNKGYAFPPPPPCGRSNAPEVWTMSGLTITPPLTATPTRW